MDFGLRLKNLRLSREITQQELAAQVGVSELTVRNWEHNKKKPNMDTLIKIALVLKISVDTLVDMPSKEKPRKTVILSPSERKLLKQYRALDSFGKKSVDTICSLEFERMMASHEIEESKTNVVALPQKPASERFIPRYTTPAAAGTSIPLDGVDFEMMLVDDSVPAQADFAVNIQGDSMYPYIKDGDMVFVQKDTRH